MKSALALCTALLLTGCANIDLSNRAARMLACDEVHIISKWTKWLGIATLLHEKDAAVLLKDCKKAE